MFFEQVGYYMNSFVLLRPYRRKNVRRNAQLRFYYVKKMSFTYIIYKNRHDVVRVILVRSRRTSDDLLTFLETNGETRNQNHLQNFRLELLRHGIARKVLHKSEKCGTFPFHCVILRHCILQKITKKLKK